MQTARPRIFHRSFCKFLEVPDISAGNAGGDSVSIFVRSIVERTSNMVALPILSAVGQVERFIDQRKVRHNIAENRVFQKGPILPRWIMCMASPDGSVRTRFEGNQRRAAPPFDHTDSKVMLLRDRNLGPNRTKRNLPENRLAETHRFEDLIEADLHASSNVTGGLRYALCSETIVGRPWMMHPQIAVNSGRSCHKPQRAEPGG